MSKKKLCKSQGPWMKKIIHCYGSVTDDLVCIGKSLLTFPDLFFDIQALDFPCFPVVLLFQHSQQLLFLFLYLLIIKTSRQIQKRSSKSFGLFFCPEFSGRVTVQNQTSLSQVLIILPGFTGRYLSEQDFVFLQDPADIRTFIQRKITAQNRHAFWICLSLLHGIIHGQAKLLIRCGACFLHDGIHEAPHKKDLRKSFFQFSVDPVQIASQKMVKTYRKKQHCFWFLIQAVQNVRYPFDGHILQVSSKKIFFLHDHKGKTVCRIHFRRSQNNTTHAIVRTDIYLMCFRDQHSRMYDIPVSVGRGIKFQPRLKGHRKRSFFYKYFCFSRKLPIANSF